MNSFPIKIKTMPQTLNKFVANIIDLLFYIAH